MNPLTQFPIVYEQKVAWGDMDAFGHVNNVMYYRYIESARIEYFDHLNVFDQDVLTVVASSQCKYLKPVFYPDVLHIGARVEEMRNSAIRMHYVLFSQQQHKIRSLAKVNLRASNSPFQQLNSFLDQSVSVYFYSVLLISENV